MYKNKLLLAVYQNIIIKLDRAHQPIFISTVYQAGLLYGIAMYTVSKKADCILPLIGVGSLMRKLLRLIRNFREVLSVCVFLAIHSDTP